MTVDELQAAIGDRDAGELVLMVGPGWGQLELGRLVTPLGLRASPAWPGRLQHGQWELLTVREWTRERDAR